MTKVYLKKKIAPRIANGHPWIFANEVEKTEGEITAGGIVDVFYADQKFAGRGYINPQSQIIVRLLTRKQEEINDQTDSLDEVRKRKNGLDDQQEAELVRLQDEQRNVGDLARDLTQPKRSDGEE